MFSFRIAMAQMNPTVGDLVGNAKKIVNFVKDAEDLGADIVMLPELAITGYPPEDLLLKPQFIKDNITELKKTARKITRMTAIIGFVDRDNNGDIFNAAAVINRGVIVSVYRKIFLPNYGVFDEKRYFKPGNTPLNIKIGRVTVGIGICEDIWYSDGPARYQALAGACIIANINASPYHTGKATLREDILMERAAANDVAIAYNNTVGGQDELVFDGRGMILNRQGKIIARGKAFEEDIIVADLPLSSPSTPRIDRSFDNEVAAFRVITENITSENKGSIKKKTIHAVDLPALDEEAEIYKALVTGTMDYVRKNGFNHTLVGLSGGIDSAIVLAIAVDALGKRNVTGIFMPSQYTSFISRVDTVALANNLDVELMTLPIEQLFEEYLALLQEPFKQAEKDVTEENIQARIRGNILMAISNKFNWLVLTTGNKSEMSVGYATLYGDMAGGFAVIKDIPKLMVYRLSHYRNRCSTTPVIPGRIIEREPSAELRPEQKDQDTLPPYEIMDPILKAYIEDDRSIDEIIKMGFDERTVKKIVRMVDRSEYKRRQSSPGIKITPKAFGKDRRMPITNMYGKEGPGSLSDSRFPDS